MKQNIIRGEIDLGLTRVKGILDRLDNPETRIAKRVVHITGTNGKGSTVEMIATGLQRLGMRVGVFTSPFLVEERDSIRVFDPDSLAIDPIAIADWVRFRGMITDLASKHNICITDFELLFLTCILYFSSLTLDVAVIEVGMGGRDDATNVFEKVAPVCVLTGVSLDHQKFLGPTVEAICENKCGIFKHNSHVIYNAEIPPACVDIVERCCEDVKAAFVVPVDNTYSASLTPPLNGDHQNLLMKIAINVIKTIIPQSRENEVLVAVGHTRLPGRLEWRNDQAVGCPLLLDGAHNPESVLALREFVNSHCENHNINRRVWIIGTSKDREEIVRLMISKSDEVIFTKFRSFQEESAPWIQPADPAELATRAETVCNNICSANDLSEALKLAGDRKDQSTIIVVAGSLYLVRNYLRLLNRNSVVNE